MKLALISLIFKKDDPSDMKCYRAISLLNNDIKIMTKIMSRRMAKVMGDIISDTQYACPGKKIWGVTTRPKSIRPNFSIS